MNLKLLFIALFISAAPLSAQTKAIAHRGYRDTEGSAQNSIAALRKAAEVGAYGSEFDVVITQDGVALVNHDDSIGGYRIETTPYRLLKDLRLPNGEPLPTPERYLEEGRKIRGVQLILEIKPPKGRSERTAAGANGSGNGQGKGTGGKGRLYLFQR